MWRPGMTRGISKRPSASVLTQDPVVDAGLALDGSGASSGSQMEREVGDRLAVDLHGPGDPRPRLEPERVIAAEVAPMGNREAGIAQGHEQIVVLLRRQRESAVGCGLRPDPVFAADDVAIVEPQLVIGRHEVDETVTRRGSVGIPDGAPDRLGSDEAVT